MIIFSLACVLAYLIGAIPIGFLVAKARGVDISQEGSGNIGATNISRVLGKNLGVLVGVLDFFKSFVPVFLAQRFFNQDWQIMLFSIMPVIGHIFPVWLNFKGGKGVATTFGIIAGYFGLLPFLVFLLIWLLMVKIIKLMSLVNLLVGILLPLAFWIKFRAMSFTVFGLALCIIIWWRHQENIKRLLAGNENLIVL
jgi:acyl phosphate:glycerol-3-phosphate acyltransferase